MKRLYLLRHAQAASDFSSSDKERTLTPHGITQAQFIATYIKDVDIALCSSAKRTQMTLDIVEKISGEIKKTELIDDIYNASAGAILNSIQSRTENNLLVVAHNPGIHMLASILIGLGDKTRCNNLTMSYPPGTLSIIDCPCENWNELQPQENTLVDLITPD